MSLQFECSAEESVTNRTTKRLKDFINVAHITYMILETQQSDNVVLFLHISSSNFSDDISIYIIYVVKQNFECEQILNKWNIVHVDSFELIGTESIHFIFELWIENFKCFFFQSLISMQRERKNTEET